MINLTNDECWILLDCRETDIFFDRLAIICHLRLSVGFLQRFEVLLLLRGDNNNGL